LDEESSDKYFGVIGDPTIQWIDRDSRRINGMVERKRLADLPWRILPRGDDGGTGRPL